MRRLPGLAMLSILLLFAVGFATPVVQAQGWRPGPSLRFARWAHAVIELPSGRLLAAGGVPDAGPSGFQIHSDRAETLDLSWVAWTEVAPMPAEHRWQQQALRLSSGGVMLVGEHPAGSRTESHVFDERDGRWSASANSPQRRRFAAELVALDADRVLYLAGYDGASDGEAFASAEIYRISTNRWEATGSLAEARFGLRAVLLTAGPLAGRVLACGGVVYDGRAPGGLATRASCEVYDPTSGVWSAGPAMGAARSFFTLTTLADGRLLAVGGRRSAAPNLASGEVFDPQALTWRPTGAMTSGRSRHTATLLPSGRVLVTGGATVDRGDPTAATTLYDPAVGSWAMGPAMSAERSDHGAQLGSDGRLIVVGGRGLDGMAMAETEVLDLGPDGDGPAVATATVAPTVTDMPTPTATDIPTTVPTLTSTVVPTVVVPIASPTAAGVAKVCPQLRGKVPEWVIAAALADPARVMGYRLAVDPGKPVSTANPERTWLSLHSYGKAYERLSNGVEFKGGCP
ncbi:MAG: hypothetical protein IPJ58_06195 [Ardenticatenia bacterium]|nr:hypothetical protein [Ardenticatenia bacterium]